MAQPLINKIVEVFNSLSPTINYFNGKGKLISEYQNMATYPIEWGFKEGFLNAGTFRKLQSSLSKVLSDYNSGKVVNFRIYNKGIKVKVFEGQKLVYKDNLVFISSNFIQNPFLKNKFKNLVNKI